MKQHTQINTVNALIEQIKKSMNKDYSDSRLSLSLTAKNKNLTFILRYFMPYTTQKLKNGNTLFLNRGYKPVGLAYESTNPMVDYEIYENVSFIANGTDDIYFYNDENTPWSSRENLILYIEEVEKYIDNLQMV